MFWIGNFRPKRQNAKFDFCSLNDSECFHSPVGRMLISLSQAYPFMYLAEEMYCESKLSFHTVIPAMVSWFEPRPLDPKSKALTIGHRACHNDLQCYKPGFVQATFSDNLSFMCQQQQQFFI